MITLYYIEKSRPYTVRVRVCFTHKLTELESVIKRSSIVYTPDDKHLIVEYIANAYNVNVDVSVYNMYNYLLNLHRSAIQSTTQRNAGLDWTGQDRTGQDRNGGTRTMKWSLVCGTHVSKATVKKLIKEYGTYCEFLRLYKFNGLAETLIFCMFIDNAEKVLVDARLANDDRVKMVVDACRDNNIEVIYFE